MPSMNVLTCISCNCKLIQGHLVSYNKVCATIRNGYFNQFFLGMIKLFGEKSVVMVNMPYMGPKSTN